jgi:hypothetical protein
MALEKLFFLSVTYFSLPRRSPVGNVEKILIVVIVVAGIAAIAAYDVIERQRDIDRANAQRRAEQQISSDSLSPLSFQSRCGMAPYRKLDERGFVISYPAQNVEVAFLADPKNQYEYQSFDYWSMQPLVPITLSEAASRLGCSPRS